MSTGIVILAAGESARMGALKQLLPYRGGTLLQHAIETALAVPDSPVVVVLGAHAEKITAEIDFPRVHVVENHDWRSGMGSSLRAGLNGLLAAHPDLSAVLFALCDQPLVTSALLRDIIARHEAAVGSLVASAYAGTLGVPALFPRRLFPELISLDASHGARHLLARYRAEAVEVPFPGGMIDIDTPSDFKALAGSSQQLSAPLPL